jgi:hypothetical protein
MGKKNQGKKERKKERKKDGGCELICTCPKP